MGLTNILHGPSQSYACGQLCFPRWHTSRTRQCSNIKFQVTNTGPPVGTRGRVLKYK